MSLFHKHHHHHKHHHRKMSASEAERSIKLMISLPYFIVFIPFILMSFSEDVFLGIVILLMVSGFYIGSMKFISWAMKRARKTKSIIIVRDERNE